MATKLLGPRFGVVSGCALIFDYVLTISTSVASGVDQIFSILPESWQPIASRSSSSSSALLVLLNLRGVKESVQVLVPIFLALHRDALPDDRRRARARTSRAPGRLRRAPCARRSATAAAIGFVPMLFIILRAYSLGAGAYTGIEAVSNGVQILREPKVRQREADHALHGGLARLHGLGHHPRLPPDRRRGPIRPRS